MPGSLASTSKPVNFWGEPHERDSLRLKRWKVWKFVLGGGAISTIAYLASFKSEVGFYQSMHFNTAEIRYKLSVIFFQAHSWHFLSRPFKMSGHGIPRATTVWEDRMPF